MKNNFLSLSGNPIGTFLLLLVLVLISKLIFLLLADLILNSVWDINFEVLIADIVNQEFKYVRAQKLTGFIDQVGTFLIPAIAITKFTKDLNFEVKKLSIKDVYLVVILLLFLLASTNILTIFSQGINLPFVPENWAKYFKSQQIIQENLQANFIGNSMISMCVNLFIMALTPAICEELFFRGSLQKIFVIWSKKKSTGIILTSLIFGALHFQIENFLAIVFASILFGYVYEIKRNLIHSVIIHFCFNSFSLITMQLIKNEIFKEELLEKIINYGITPVGLAIAIVLSYTYFRKK
ncbi:MAG: CPBP family intramembrane metalloprotease [Flavobacteriales bacterium]|nr:CPBP family intramembrane metalloprotease [Flavobacteriales bacterium]